MGVPLARGRAIAEPGAAWTLGSSPRVTEGCEIGLVHAPAGASFDGRIHHTVSCSGLTRASMAQLARLPNRSSHVGLACSISQIFQARFHRFSSFSRAIAEPGAAWTLGSSPTAFTHLLSRLAFEITV